MTREEAIENLKMILEEATSEKNSVCYVTSCDEEPLKMAIESLENHAECEHDCKSCWKTKLVNDTNKWIPCSERLPEKKDNELKCGRGEYNGTVADRKGHVFTTSVIYDYNNKKWVEEDIWEVIAWQPLPEPYKEGDI